ncbi:hypothetical protein FOA52_003910 [Chlamydomonas sp. UWO 241]|nr:hypothetical protein FOA52_003910 [Chlamydomonas sp. UWO 241]
MWCVIRTIMDVAAGEELTIDYTQEVVALQPVHVRRAALLRDKEFLCECPRCSAHGDDTRRFPCQAKECGGHHLVHQPTDADEASLLPCSCCGAAAQTAYAASLLRGESALVSELRTTNEIIDSGRRIFVDVVSLIQRLKAPHHPHHHLAGEVARVKWELARNVQQWGDAAEAKRAEIECRNAIVRIPRRDTAVCFGNLGDALVAQAGASASAQASVLLGEAQEAYQRALQGLIFVLGPDHPWTGVAATKLAAVQARMLRSASPLRRHTVGAP